MTKEEIHHTYPFRRRMILQPVLKVSVFNASAYSSNVSISASLT